MSTPDSSWALTLCALVWARPGRERELVDYERQVLALLVDHDASVLLRFVLTEHLADAPTEVQILQFPSRPAYEAYLGDERRTRLLELRDSLIARISVFTVNILDQKGSSS